ncbi:hypothetical protein [Sanguibacter sp. HDW7]|uniref:hypothetical protein n=1 Tax=Sanguibacter sp. HDW7 TaxID=2714931 RepID=UPI00140A8BEF|nr:hypothetical protein [Sanguibacter sp. HDW7]QIK83098.1 hypothetical protein G7063_05250 [Sanguibacter sp. HDW7]
MSTCPVPIRSRYGVVACDKTCPPGMTVCGDCANALAIRLLYVPLTLAALEDAWLKAQRFSVRSLGATSSEEAPVPFNDRAGSAARTLRSALLAIATTLAAATGRLGPVPTDVGLARYLAQAVPTLRARHDGPTLVAQLSAALDDADRSCDRPADRVPLGRCRQSLEDGRTCDATVYAARGQDVARCACGAEHDVRARRAALLGRAEHLDLPATQLARAIDGLGVEVTPKQIDNWVQRGRLTPAGMTSTRPARRTYRVGDVLDIVNADAARREARARPASA